MRPIQADEFARLCGGELAAQPDLLISGFATDSRQIVPGDLFIAIPGERVDGHAFAAQAISNGASLVLAAHPLPEPHILVDDIPNALGRFAEISRENFAGPVVAITGSAGKTTTKEFVASALTSKGGVVKTAGNRNTEYTSPLIWSEVSEDTNFVVIEMAMRGFGQIAHLAKFVRPDIGLITNIGHSHLMQLGSREGIAKAKGELLENLNLEHGIAILWQEDDYLETLLTVSKAQETYTFGSALGSDCHIQNYRVESWSSTFISGKCLGEPWEMRLPAVGRHIALDAAAAILTAKLLGVAPTDAVAAIEETELPPMRMEVKELNGATVLLDTYNASPMSVLAAIDVVSEMPAQGKRIAILADMRELGDASGEAHRQVGDAVNASRMDVIYFIGDSMKDAHARVTDSSRTKWFENSEPARDLVANLGVGDVLLIKGSRALELEKLLEN